LKAIVGFEIKAIVGFESYTCMMMACIPANNLKLEYLVVYLFFF
jgi:hypothetical protein